MLFVNRYGRTDKLGYLRSIFVGGLFFSLSTVQGAADVQSRHGTVIGAFFNTGTIIVAADSREVDANNRPVNSSKCKISRLDDSHFFFSFGKTKFIDLSRNILVDAHEGARNIFQPSTTVHGLSETWGARMEKDIHKVARVDHQAIASGRSKGSIVQGVFGGSDAQGNLAMSKADVAYSASVTANIALNHSVQDIKFDDEGMLRAFGIDEVGPYIGEFLTNQTPRAKRIRDRLSREIDGLALQKVDGQALFLKTAVEFAIASAHDQRIGGEVSVLVAEKGQPIRWFHQAAGCR
jgi:hypothetical protein